MAISARCVLVMIEQDFRFLAFIHNDIARRKCLLRAIPNLEMKNLGAISWNFWSGSLETVESWATSAHYLNFEESRELSCFSILFICSNGVYLSNSDFKRENGFMGKSMLFLSGVKRQNRVINVSFMNDLLLLRVWDINFSFIKVVG